MSDSSTHDRSDRPAAAQEPTSSGRANALGSGVGQPVMRADQPTVISQRTPLPGPLNLSTDHPAELGRTLLGQKLDHFELLEYVGGGGMGAVFKALDTRLNRIVALKVLARDHADEDEKVRRFQNEAQSAARLDHDHIARVYFVGQDCGLHYIVFEYIEGINLRELVERKGPLQLDEAISFTLQIAEALAHASSRDVVHRDIKPSNVLITPQGRAKLVDMGLARLHQVEHSQNDLTSSGVTLGTFDYISPEQARDPRSADVRSDIYSLGCTLYFTLTGKPPFPEGNVLQKLLQHNNDPPPDPAEYNPDLPEVVSRLVRKMLAKDPRKRHQRAGELVSELLAIADQLGLSTQGLEALSWTTPKPSLLGRFERHLPWVAPLVLLLSGVLVLEFWSASQLTEFDPSEPETRRSAIAGHPTPDYGTSQRESANSSAPAGGGADFVDRPTVPPETNGEQSNGNTPVDPTIPRLAGNDGSSTTEADRSGARLTMSTYSAAIGPPADAAEISIEGDSLIDSAAVPPAASGGTAQAALNSTQTVRTAETVSTAADRPGVLVVKPFGTASHEFASLRHACEVAKKKGIDVIELQFDGRQEERPIRLDNQKLTIRAAENYEPIVVFRPKEFGVGESQPMISVIGGQLTILQVALEFDVPERMTQPCSLFETQRPELLRLKDCWLTIRNANPQRQAINPDVAFFDIKAPPGRDAMEMGISTAVEPTVVIELEDTVARGEATLLRAQELQPVSLSWVNGLLASSERLLWATGGSMLPRQGMISIDLQHVTAMARGGLFLISNEEGSRPLLQTDISCADSILLAAPDAALIEQTGVSTTDEFEDQLAWSGTRYFYFGFDTFWRISTIGSPQQPMEREFDQWQAYWQEMPDNNEMWSQVTWQRLPELRPYHSHTPADYALGEQNNKALKSASDGVDAGMKLDDLPPQPRSAAEPVSGSTSEVAPRNRF